jgi:hypothetical protein
MKKTLKVLSVCAVLCTVVIQCAPAPASVQPTAAPVSSTATPVTPPESSAVDTPEAPTATSQEAAEPTGTPASVPPTATLPSFPEPTWKGDGLIGDGEYLHTVEAAGVEFHWTNDDEILYAALTAQTTGWVSVGFDPEARMQGANFIFGYVQDGTPFVQDMFGVRPVGQGSHPPDEELGGTDDVLEYGGQEQGDLTIIEFRIPLDSGDQYDKPLSSGMTYSIILAVGLGDDFDSYHTAHGYSEIVLD